MSAFVLKLAALVTMVLDHAAVVCNDSGFPPSLAPDAYALLRTIGRISFPLFAFLMAEGFRHTRNVKRYAARLLGLGALSQAVYAAAMVFAGTLREAAYFNVLFTLAAGVGLLCWLEMPARLSGAVGRLTAQIGRLAAAILAYRLVCWLSPLRMDYGAAALALFAALHWAQSRAARAGVIALWGFLYYFGAWGYAAAVLLPALLVLRYNGTRGIDDRRLFYWAYPAHLALLWGSAALFYSL